MQVAIATETDPGYLSKIERGIHTPSKETAERLAAHFPEELTELHIIYPERYTAAPKKIEILYPESFFQPQQPTKTKETKTR